MLALKTSPLHELVRLGTKHGMLDRKWCNLTHIRNGINDLSGCTICHSAYQALYYVTRSWKGSITAPQLDQLQVMRPLVI